MSRLPLAAIAMALGLLGAPIDPAAAGGRVALIVGNSSYQHAPALPNPAKDAQAMAATFQKAGFDVINTAYNVGNLEFKRAIRQFEHAATDADIAVVYYAGHGIEIHGINYLVPVDASLVSDDDAEDEAIPLERLIQSVDGAKRLRVVILDACRDNPFRSTMKQHPLEPKPHPAEAPHGTTRGLAPAGGLVAIQASDINTLIAYAAKAGSTALDGDDEHSPFTTALIDNLFVAGLDIRLAFGRVRDEVLKATNNRQEPFVYGSLGGGNISLVPAPGQPATAAEDPEKVKTDYSLVEKIGTKGAWQVFLTQHPAGFYSDLARQQIASLEAAAPARNLTLTPAPEEQQAWADIKDSTNSGDFRDFIKKYPSSVLAPVADVRADALEQAARQREREAILKSEEQALRVQLAEAKRQAEEAAQQRAAEDAALAKAQHAAEAAEQARQQAEREAQQKAAEAARQKQLADAALAQQQAAAAAAKEKNEQDAAAAQKKAERDAALAKAQLEAEAAEQARQAAERDAAAKAQEAAKQAAVTEAARKQEAACSDEQSRLDTLQAAGGKAKDDLKKLADGLRCERLRPLVLAALEKASTNTPDQVRAAQQQLARLGCYSDAVDGALSDSTKAAIAHYRSARGSAANASGQITDAFVAELKSQSARVCPLVCSSGKVAQGDQCVVVEQAQPAPAVAHREGDETAKPSKKAKAEENKRRPAKQESASRPPPPRVTQEASTGGGHGGAAIGVGF